MHDRRGMQWLALNIELFDGEKPDAQKARWLPKQNRPVARFISGSRAVCA